ncbi:MAG: hypothetical protein AB7G51_08430 [Steroidobacteraceae bacterium]
MALTTLTLGGNLFRTAPRPRVFVRQRWNIDWTEITNLRCTSIRQCAAPDVGAITIAWRFGPGRLTDGTVFEQVSELSLLGWFVKVEVAYTDAAGDAQTYRAYGVIWEEDHERKGRQREGTEWLLSGEQTYIAYGLEFLYRRQIVDRTLFRKLTGSIQEIRRALEFNAPNPFQVNENDQDHGNCSVATVVSDVHLFDEDLENAQPWTTRKIVRYLHHVFAPLGSNDWDRMQWTLDPAYVKYLPVDDRPRLAPHGRELGSVLDELLDRRRGLSWYVTVDEANNRPLVRPFSLAGDVIALPDGGTVEPNEAQFTLYSDRATEAGPIMIKRSLNAQFDQVRVRGERVRSCFSVSFADGTLEPDWTTAERNQYNAGASALGGYPADTAEREEWNARARSKEELSRVFCCFRLPDTFSSVRDGLGGTEVSWLPSLEATGSSPGTAEPIYRPDCRLLNELPLRDLTDAGRAKRYLAPMVFVRVAAGDVDKYHPIEKLAELAQIEELGDGAGVRWSAYVRMAQHDAALWLEVSGGFRHALAKHASDFVAIADGSDDRLAPQYDWRADLVATVAMEAQRHVEAVWPEDAALGETDALRRLVIEIGDRGRLDYMPQGTVEGLDEDGKLRHRTGSLYLRDDRVMMRELARRAFLWYAKVRQAVRLPVQGFYPLLPIGGFVREIGDPEGTESIEAAVTSVEFDFVRSSSVIQTDFAELDYRQA